jgi:hypothetical protein
MPPAVVLFLASAAAQSTPAPSDFPANAKIGLVQCYRPNLSEKTCQSIAGYTLNGPDRFDNKAVIAVSKDATLETHTPVVVRNGAVCGFIRAEDIIAGLLRVNGRQVDAAKAKPILEQIAHGAAPFAGKEICTRYESSAAGLTAEISIDWIYKPDRDQTVLWVHPSDGYTVAP